MVREKARREVMRTRPVVGVAAATRFARKTFAGIVLVIVVVPFHRAQGGSAAALSEAPEPELMTSMAIESDQEPTGNPDIDALAGVVPDGGGEATQIGILAPEVRLPSDAEILGDDDRSSRRVRLEEIRARFTFYDQYGRGYQSKAGPPEGPGDQRLLVWQPQIQARLRQWDERFSHQLRFEADVVTAASPDALDAVSSASRWNEAFTLEATSSVELRHHEGDDSPRALEGSTWFLRYGIHLEEHWRTGIGGFGWSGSFNDDNTVVSTSLNFIYDYFDDIFPRGHTDGQTHRYTLNQNVGLTQILSATTLLAINYGLTFQTGTLENGWNSVYLAGASTQDCLDDPEQLPEYDCVNRRRENLPTERIRHAGSVQINQHIPRLRHTIKADYRYYRDDFGLRAHSARIQAYQWLGRRIYLRGHYRFHHQTGVDWFHRFVPFDVAGDVFATADSDLERFIAHEFGAKAVVYILPIDGPKGPLALDVAYTRYQRTNDLRMNVFGVGIYKGF